MERISSRYLPFKCYVLGLACGPANGGRNSLTFTIGPGFKNRNHANRNKCQAFKNEAAPDVCMVPQKALLCKRRLAHIFNQADI